MPIIFIHKNEYRSVYRRRRGYTIGKLYLQYNWIKFEYISLSFEENILCIWFCVIILYVILAIIAAANVPAPKVGMASGAAMKTAVEPSGLGTNTLKVMPHMSILLLRELASTSWTICEIDIINNINK